MRTSRIKSEMDAQQTAGKDGHTEFRAEMEQVFKRRAAQSRNSGIMQLTFILLFTSIFVGYLFFGNNVIYIALILLPLYILYRRKTFSRKE